jgi:predicted acyltransferase
VPVAFVSRLTPGLVVVMLNPKPRPKDRKNKTIVRTSGLEAENTNGRQAAIDLYRGIVMFFLIAEATGLYELLAAPAFGGTLVKAVGLQFQHHPWSGLRIWDLGQPSFFFISGAAMFFSYSKRWQLGERWGDSLVHALYRSLMLFTLGWAIYRIAPVEGSSPGAFLYDILPQLAFASLLAFLILRCRSSRQLLLSFGLLIFTEIAYRLLAPPGFDQPFEPDHNFGSYLDSLLLGRLSTEHWVAFNIVPSSVFVIWGALAGRWLLQTTGKLQKALTMSALGMTGIACGLALSLVTPIIRRISTSSFVVMSGGFCLFALALAYWIMNSPMIRRGAPFFLAVGRNPLFIYVFAQAGGSDWLRSIVTPFVRGVFSRGEGSWSEMAASLAILGLMWGLCAWLYRRRILIRI